MLAVLMGFPLIASGPIAAAEPFESSRELSDNPDSRPEVTQHEIVPLMLLRCTACHGLRRQEGDLDLRTKASMLKGGKSGPAIVPGNPDESLILKMIHAGKMPPRERLVEVGVKPMTESEIERLAKWIELGAPEVQVTPDVATGETDPLVSDEDRQFWAFRPPGEVVVPEVRHSERVQNPVDAFVLKKLEESGLSFSPEADRLTLLRRAYFDLIGLPPEPNEVEAFLEDDAPDAYERLVDRLLASPRYGERWGRHWLDVAGYADSEGKRAADPVRPYAYRYRDYVIRSFNADKPYDRFLLEQIAGDELADYENASVITREMVDNLVATGFLRMAPDGTGSDAVNFTPDRFEVINDAIEILGGVVLGLTLKCARCHDHHYDPIPQRDYYRLVDVFKGAYDEHDWLKPTLETGQTKTTSAARVLPHVTQKEQREWEAHEALLAKEISGLKKVLQQKSESIRKQLLQQRLSKLPEVLHADLRRMLATPPEKRDDNLKYLAVKFGTELQITDAQLEMVDTEFKRAATQTEELVKAAEDRRLPKPLIRALWDRGEPSPTYIYRRGDYLNPGRLVGSGVPAVLTDVKTSFQVRPPWPGAKKTGRRLALARWLTEPDHPLTARVMINRIWKHHFGTGIVKSLDNFGHTGDPPSHPKLLDWLARGFIERGWSIKAMHRLMMTSSTYRQVSTRPSTDREGEAAAYETIDPDNRLLSRMPMKRMEAEVLRDSILWVSGQLDSAQFGRPDPVEYRKEDGLVTSLPTERGWRRSVYIQQRRRRIPTILANFDLPQMNPNCIERIESTVTPQALHLMNNAMIQELARHFAERTHRHTGPNNAEQIQMVYMTALSRPPTDQELMIGLQALAELTEQWSNELQRGTNSPSEEDLARAATAVQGEAPIPPKPQSEEIHTESAVRALTNFCHTILNSAQFLYID